MYVKIFELFYENENTIKKLEIERIKAVAQQQRQISFIFMFRYIHNLSTDKSIHTYIPNTTNKKKRQVHFVLNFFYYQIHLYCSYTLLC